MKKRIITLKKNYEFKNVLSKGKYYINRQIIVYIKQNKTNKNRLGIAINTKLCHAFMRNRIKRLIRENYRTIECNIKQGYDIVFLWNKNTMPIKADYFTIKEDMNETFKKAGIL